MSLASRQLDAIFAHLGVQPLVHLADEFPGVGRLGRFDDLRFIGMPRNPVGNVGADGVVKQHDILADQRDIGAQAFQLQVFQMMSIEHQTPRTEVIEARNQRRH